MKTIKILSMIAWIINMVVASIQKYEGDDYKFSLVLAFMFLYISINFKSDKDDQ